ncbi:type II secretion system F family protein [Halarchaeum sp. CBA1220]|uniref:type II secretion system F family protein n=1 Tax=Halarchaeum sp. CBA1220 TaxID=1853682 RepID=UPI000F3A95B0|nr:type II secretion system F family protein [Halarchaeum sp. CBA1220]QLC33666.1 type II secretion system F family protein [Halarchaeum sp. CBA1220]
MSAGDRGDELGGLPEYEVGQYFPERPAFDREDLERLREEYGRVRAYAKLHPERFRDLQRWLNQGRVGTTYDLYVARSARYAGYATVVGLLVGVVVAYVLANSGLLAGLRSPVPVRGGGLVDLVSANKVGLAASLVAVLLAAAAGIGTFAGRYYYPAMVVSTRRANVEFVLPHAIVYMYALSYGGMNLVEVVEKVADAEDAYGEVANEFESVRRDVDLFGNDLLTALRNTRNLTPSASLERFLDDLVSVLDAGGDVTAFFEEQSDEYLRNAKEEQEDFLETLSIYSEIFITAFVATPLFLIVILMVISFLGGQSLAQMYALIYVALPVGMGAFLFLVSVLSSAYSYPPTTLDVEEFADTALAGDALAGDERYAAYRDVQRRERIEAFLSDPLRAVRDDPPLALLVSVPLALVLAGAVAVGGFVPLDYARFLEAPARNTARLVVYPLLVAVVPLSLFHELKRGRESAIVRRFPSTLNILSSANSMGIPFTDALELVSRWSTGTLGQELRLVRNDIQWNGDVSRALVAFANRLNIPQLSRTMKLVADGSRSTGDLARVLSIAADDTRERYRIERQRRREMSSYIAVVLIGFLVYLMVIVLLDTSYIQPIARLAAEQGAQQVGQIGGPISLTNVPVNTYRMLFFHSVLIQGVGAGLLAGKLAENDVLSGLKYSILLVTLALIAFAFI